MPQRLHNKPSDTQSRFKKLWGQLPESFGILANDDVHEFKPALAEIEHDPGNPLGTFTFWLVMAIFAFFLLWTIFGQVDVVVSAPGLIIPTGEIKTIQPLNGGVVSQILVKEGDFVHKGQPLVYIDPSTTEPNLQAQKDTLTHVQLEQQRLTATAGYGTMQGDGSVESKEQQDLYHASVASMQSQLGAKQQAIADLSAQIRAREAEREQVQEQLTMNLSKRQDLDSVRDIIARDEYDHVQNDIIAEQGQIRILTHEIEQYRADQRENRAEMGYISQNFKTQTLSDLSDKQKQVIQLQANLQESTFKNARQTLTAPVDGYVHELFIHTVGGVVTPAQKILSIVPNDTPLLVQATVLNKDIGFVKEGMPVAIKVDTFDFQKYGTIKGVVTQVDKDSREDQKLGPVYTIYVKPLNHQILVDGHWQNLSTGLSVTAEVKTGKRHIIEFFIYPLIKHLDEGMSVR